MINLLLALLIAGSAQAYKSPKGTVKGKVDSFDEKNVTLVIEKKKYKVARKHFEGQTLKVGEEAKTEIDIKELEGSVEPSKKD